MGLLKIKINVEKMIKKKMCIAQSTNYLTKDSMQIGQK